MCTQFADPCFRVPSHGLLFVTEAVTCLAENADDCICDLRYVSELMSLFDMV